MSLLVKEVKEDPKKRVCEVSNIMDNKFSSWR